MNDFQVNTGEKKRSEAKNTPEIIGASNDFAAAHFKCKS